MNWCRGDLHTKRDFISLQHVESHQAVESVESNGNDEADTIANEFRQKSEYCDPLPYFTLAEERIVFQQRGNNIQGDIREILKSIEKEKLMETWLEKTKVQSQFIKKIQLKY